MRNFFILVTALCFPVIVFSQIANPGANLIPQSPQNAALFKYTETPVSYYNGTISTNIPVYEIAVGNFKFPISLNYHSGGIRVEEEATWVGLGWVLNASGVISENVVGTKDPDELGHTADYMRHNIIPNKPLGRDGKPLNVIERGTCFPDFNGTYRDFGLKNSTNYAFLPSSNREYDLFMYNFNGFAGKLINPRLNFYEDKFISLDNNNIKFTLSSNYFESGDLKAVTPDGTIYLFNDIENSLSYNGTNSPVNRYSKHLSKIITTEGRTINFKYKKVNVIEVPPASHSYYSRIVDGSGSGTVTEWVNSRTIAKTTMVQMLYLEEISWDNGVIKFNSDNNRQDVAGGLKLNSIEVYNGNNRLIRKAIFAYDYFIGDIKYGDYFTQGNFQQPSSLSNFPAITEDIRKKRLKLLSVKIDDMSPYSFTYNSGSLPYKTGFAKDMWSYFNGVNFDMVPYPYVPNWPKYSLLPDPAGLGYYDATVATWMNSLPGIVFGQRQPDATAMQMATLTQVKYPTGGHTDFEYEPNQFAAPDGVSYVINKTGYVRLMDGNVPGDKTQEEFTIPNVNPGSMINNGTIDIRLFCGNCVDPIGNSKCYNYMATTATDRKQYGLFVMLEHWNGNSWDIIKIWDYADADIVSNHGVLSRNYDFIQDDKYRLTANYPDYCTGDYYGQKVASIQATYYQRVQNSSPTGIGGGIRIKTVSDYEKDGNLAAKRQFTYENGVLMTKPLFMRFVTYAPMTFRAKTCVNPDPCHNCDVIGDFTPIYLPGTTQPVDMTFFSGYYSEPTIPYSYAANGSLVGYKKVTEQYMGSKSNGKTEYVYHNQKDLLLNEWEASYFGAYDYRSGMKVDLSKPAGIPTIKDPLNGTLESKTVYVKTPTDMNILQKTGYQYRVDNAKIYWGFKTELTTSGIKAAGTACNFGTQPLAADYDKCYELSGTTLYFHPVSSFNINLASKTEEYYDAPNKLTTTSTYTYNAKNQQQEESVTDSKGRQVVKATYYVADRQTGDPVLQEMQNRNMLDYPVEQINDNRTLGKEQSRKQTTYSFWNGNSLILPGNLKSSVLGSALQTDLVNNRVDSKGNLLQYTAKDGIPVSFVWGYKQSYPIAKITGATYDQVLAALGQTDADVAYLQNMSDADLEVELNKIRNNITGTVPLAQVNTYLYIPLVGMKQATNAAGRRSFYEYDEQGRLILIKDQNGHVVKTFEYKY